MTEDQLAQMFNTYKATELNWVGNCHDCGETVSVLARLSGDTEIEITGGAVYQTDGIIDNGEPEAFLKCQKCHGNNRVLRSFQSCEVYARVVGYLRPVKQWNEGKAAEYENRKMFNIIP